MTFEELTRFCELIASHKYPKTPTLENEDSNAFKLFKGLSQGSYKSREEAIEGIFGEKGTLKKYRELKHELKEKLINTTVLMNPKHPSQSVYGMEYIENNKLWSSVLILIQMKDQDFAMKFGEFAYKKISKGIATDLKFLLSYKLVTNYGFIKHNTKKFKYYQKEFEVAQQELNAEILARKYLAIISYHISTATPKDKVISTCDSFIEELNIIKKNISTTIFNRIYYLLNFQYYTYTNQKIQLEIFCLENSKSAKNIKNRLNFNAHLLKLYAVEKDFKKGIKQIEILKSNPKPISISVSFSRAYLYFLHYAYCGKKKEYIDHFNYLKEFENKKIFSAQRDCLKIIDAYMHFVTFHDNEQYKLSKFKINKFLNNVPEISKHKNYGNISIIVIHILILLLQNKRRKILDRMEALEQYSYRYLKTGPTLRSNCFIKMLKSMTRADFNRKRTIRYSEKYLKKLKESKIYLFVENPAIEVFPYEDLWEMVLELLD